jgi:tRNA G46 methylase TrmB
MPRDRHLDPDRWEPPAPLPPGPGGIRGALAGSRLLDQPEHAAFRDDLRAFLASPGPVALDVGIDHGTRFLDHARRFPEVRWLGSEIRRRRVAALQPHVPPNARVVATDARTLLAAVVPDGRLSWVYVLFPSPSNDPRHLLVTPELVAHLARTLAPAGAVHFATDVPGMARWIAACLAGWQPTDPPPSGPVLTRRERVCARDGRRVWRFTATPG